MTPSTSLPQDDLDQKYKISARDMADDFLSYLKNIEHIFGQKRTQRIKEGVELLIDDNKDLSNASTQRPGFFFMPSLNVSPVYDIDPQSPLGQLSFALSHNFKRFKSEVIKSARPTPVATTLYSETKFNLETEHDWTYVSLYENNQWWDEKSALKQACEPFTSFVNEVILSRLAAGKQIHPHYDNNNYSLTLHFGLNIPPKDCGIEVEGKTYQWENGKAFAFTHSYLHRAWNNTSQARDILLMDLWHPDLSLIEIKCIEMLRPLSQKIYSTIISAN